MLAVMLQAAGIDNVVAKANKRVSSSVLFYRACLDYAVVTFLTYSSIALAVAWHTSLTLTM